MANVCRLPHKVVVGAWGEVEVERKLGRLLRAAKPSGRADARPGIE